MKGDFMYFMFQKAKAGIVLPAGFFLVACCLFLPVTAGAKDLFYRIPFARFKTKELKITSGSLPASENYRGYVSFRERHVIMPYVSIEGEGEAYIAPMKGSGGWRSGRMDSFLGGSLVIRAPQSKAVKGTLYMPDPEYSGMTRTGFEVPADWSSKKERRIFYETKRDYYRALLEREIPGAAWFRHQVIACERALGEKDAKKTRPEEGDIGPLAHLETRRRGSDITETYSLFTGGRALSENLQLDRMLADVDDRKTKVDISTLAGITTKEIDWNPYIEGKDPEKDPLSVCIPSDQYALFFSSFQALMALLDEAQANGAPVLQLFEARAEDAGTRERLERQLCLQVGELDRLMGPAAVKSVAMTSSDPYLRTGSDVAVLFEAANASLLHSFLQKKLDHAADSGSRVEKKTGKVNGISYTAVISPYRGVCSYLFSFENVCVVTNSLFQAERIVRTMQKKADPIASLSEYIFFRSRYRLKEDGESAFLVVPDAAIRRLCSPRWRIAASRRVRTAAVMAELQASYAEALVDGTAEEKRIRPKWKVPGAGAYTLTSQGVVSSVHNTISFMTPIAEIPLEKVTEDEAENYRRWRSRYQSRWRRYFDPIAVRFSLKKGAVAMDMTVMPLIAGTDYRDLIELTRGAELSPSAGDPHDTLLHFIMAVNKDSRYLKMGSSFMRGTGPAIGIDPLGWIGESIGIFVEETSFWKDLEQAEDTDDFMENNFHHMPLAVRIDNKNSLKLTAFLTALRGMINQSAPGLTTWETLKYNEKPYVRITPSAKESGVPEDFAVYYAALSGYLLITLNEPLLQRALKRTGGSPEEKEAENPGKKKPGEKQPDWLGKSVNLRVSKKGLLAFYKLIGREYQRILQHASWSNITILNELKKQFPDQDPNTVCELLWQTKKVCPGGGTYSWNDKWQTMESSVYGHPGDQQEGPQLPQALKLYTGADFGVTFEDDGIRAVVKLKK